MHAVVLFALCACVCAKIVTISNVAPRRDVHGYWMDAHDGKIVQWEPNGLYYYYAMSYGMCREASAGCGGSGGDPGCGFRQDHNISVYTSPDLSNWTYKSDALPVASRPPAAQGVYYRPKVIYNRNTKMYVLWANVVPHADFSKSIYVVATSRVPEGPFTVVGEPTDTMKQPSPGDFDLFVDDDDSAYIIYTSVNNGHQMSIERLTPDYYASTGTSSGFFGKSFVEAPAMIKRGSIYYALFGHCCCFCVEGSGVGVYTASHPLGPYATHDNIGCNYTEYATGPYGCQVDHGTSITHAQQNCIIKAETTSGTVLLWTGDRWQSAPDKIKAHDFQYWTPMVFDNSSIPVPRTFHWIDSFTLDMP